jgi:membrane protease YdiL (CAAX protease family)
MIALLLPWTFMPCLAMWVGVYEIKSAMWAYALYHFLVLAPAIIWGRSLWLPTLKLPSLKDFLLLVGATVIACAGAVSVYETIGGVLLSNEHVPSLMKEYGVTRGSYILFALYATIINPLLEELFWRGVVFNELDRRQFKFKYFAITWSSITYALFHYFVFRLILYPGWAEVGIIMLAGFGAMLALIYRKTGSILTTALAHGLLTDFAFVVIVIDYFRKFGMP